MKVLDHGIQVEALELLGVVERLAHGIGQGRVLVENPQVQLIGPPVLIRHGPNRRALVRPARHRALAIAFHVNSIRILDFYNLYRPSDASAYIGPINWTKTLF